jgi:hypothetical protein
MVERRVRWAILWSGIASIALLGCSATPSAKVDYDSSNDFATYQSFTWLSENPMKVAKVVSAPRSTLQPAIKAAVLAYLEKAGYQFVSDETSADFLLSFTVGSREEIGGDSYSSTSAGTGGRGGWGTAYFPGGDGTSYTQGMLAIDVFDAEERRPVWHGVTGKKISESDRDRMETVIEEAVESILTEFPQKN